MPVTSDDIRRMFPNVTDHQVVEILDCGATVSDLTQAAAYLEQENDVMAALERPLTGRARLVFDLLRPADAAWEEDR